MKIDLLHNKIVKETVSPSFVESFMEGLVPVLEEKYGDSLVEVQMYEDYLNDGFVFEGEFYYPLTLAFEDTVRREWIKWRVSEKKRFKAGIPYSYVGNEPLIFEIAETVPREFENKLVDRGIYFEGGYMPINIETASDDSLFLVGKYSQTFVDEMARQISREIEKTFSISGIADSTVTLTLAYAPGTFMEQTVDGFTYRRLLITAKGCTPKDLWIKWNKGSVTDGEVTFEIGEDVPHRIREKEYRYLVHSSTDEYQSAMGRKNVTEWRGLIKRVIKRGEVELNEAISIVPDENSDLTFKLQDVLGFSAPTESEVPEVTEKADSDIAQKAEEIIDTSESGEIADSEIKEDADSELTLKLQEVLGLSLGTEHREPAPEENSNNDLDALLRGVLGVKEEPETVEFSETYDSFALKEESNTEENTEIVSEEEPACVTSCSEVNEEVSKEEPAPISYEDELRKKIEAEIREKLELEAKMKAEEEAFALRRAHDELLAENERLAEMARKAEEEKLAAEAERIAEAERLRFELEARERAEAREKERLAEAARLALMEQQRLIEARAEEEKRRAEEEARIREEQRRREEEALLAEARLREEQRIRAEMQARAEATARAEAEKQRRLEEEEAKKAKEPKYTYVSKVAKLLFRYSVDPNITKRIQEIILSTVKYFHKEDVYIKIRATVPDATTVHLYFDKIPAEENELLINIIKVLGKSDLGITKVYLE